MFSHSLRLSGPTLLPIHFVENENNSSRPAGYDNGIKEVHLYGEILQRENFVGPDNLNEWLHMHYYKISR